jgi:hypothetical protein
MGRIILGGLMAIGGALMLAGCGLAESRAPVPEFMRLKETEPTPPEPAPDVRQMVREKLDSVFIATSYPRDVRVSPPHRDPRGPGWIACVRAELKSATGQPIGVQTYRIIISGSVIMDRRRAETDDNCVSETYEPI